MNNLHRIFIAIDLPQKLKKDLCELRQKWPALPAKWTEIDNLHITLLFFGNANDEEVGNICERTLEVAKRHDPFEISLERIVYGPPQKNPPKMVWAVGEKSAEMGSIQKDLETVLYEFSGGEYSSEKKYIFAPHITLARIRQFDLKQMDSCEIPDIDEKFSHKFAVTSIEVVESELKRGGPAYTVLENARLGE